MNNCMIKILEHVVSSKNLKNISRVESWENLPIYQIRIWIGIYLKNKNAYDW
jgi:hypothetical protein